MEFKIKVETRKGVKLMITTKEQTPGTCKCDGCGKTINRVKYPVYDENFNLQEGLNYCKKCFHS